MTELSAKHFHDEDAAVNMDRSLALAEWRDRLPAVRIA